MALLANNINQIDRLLGFFCDVDPDAVLIELKGEEHLSSPFLFIVFKTEAFIFKVIHLSSSGI